MEVIFAKYAKKHAMPFHLAQRQLLRMKKGLVHRCCVVVVQRLGQWQNQNRRQFLKKVK